MSRVRIDPERLQDVTLRTLSDRGLTQQQLAGALDVSLGTVSNWARGNGGRPDLVLKLVAFIDGDLDDVSAPHEPAETPAGRIAALETVVRELVDQIGQMRAELSHEQRVVEALAEHLLERVDAIPQTAAVEAADAVGTAADVSREQHAGSAQRPKRTRSSRPA